MFLAVALAALVARSDAGAQPPAIGQAKQLTVGSAHSCALIEGVGVRCWGANGQGPLGDGTSVSRRAPVVAGLEGATSISAGAEHTCALVDDAAMCWGANASGKLGATSSDACGDFACSLTPIEVTGLTSGVARLAAGYGHTCAVTTKGALLCWGLNLYGQLGDGTEVDRGVPTGVSGLDAGVANVAPGDVFTCALLTDGTVRCWGSNSAGELGNAGTADSFVPVAVCADASCASLFGNVTQVAAADFHACALTTAGDVYCWGANDDGQLGVETAEVCGAIVSQTCSTVPIAVTLPEPAVSVAAGGVRTCAVLESGAVYCWGRGFVGTPAEVDGMENVTALAVGARHICATTSARETMCFGANASGQLGDATTVSRDAPQRVWSLSGRGDANCDGWITSVDAAYVLQFVATLTDALPCPDSGATPGAVITSADALLILQYDAGLIA
jgi:hypothetical protein